MYSFYSAQQRQLDLVGRLQAEVARFMHLGDVRASSRGDSILFVGRLLTGAEEAYRPLRDIRPPRSSP